LPDRPIVISFDDGFADFHMAAAPALAERRMRATLYVTTAYLGQTSRWLQRDGEADRKMLTSDQVRDLAADGFEIGAHGHSHAMLDALSTPSARHDIGRSRHILEDVLGSRIRTFAYPHGYSSRRVRRIVQDEGFMAGLGVRHAVSSPADDPYAVSRIVVTGDTSSAGLLSLLDGVGIEISDGRERVATRAWRGWRRSTAIRQRRLAGREAL
jgi:peptidoglycan/xylan/chitin deacetylase (PgdA/CDA1 family)